MNQDNLSEILKTEIELCEKIPLQYVEFLEHALASFRVLQSPITLSKSEGWLFFAFFSQVKKHHLLALLSSLRLHHVQASMNLRQLLESGTNAAYALAEPSSDNFYRVTPEGILEIPESLKQKKYKWLKKNHPDASESLKKMKDAIQPSSHSNIVDAYRIFRTGTEDSSLELETSFFDMRNDFQVKGDLWSVGNIPIGILDLIYGINQAYNRITFPDNFVEQLLGLDKESKRLKILMMNTPNYKRADERMKQIKQ